MSKVSQIKEDAFWRGKVERTFGEREMIWKKLENLMDEQNEWYRSPFENSSGFVDKDYLINIDDKEDSIDNKLVDPFSNFNNKELIDYYYSVEYNMRYYVKYHTILGYFLIEPLIKTNDEWISFEKVRNTILNKLNERGINIHNN